MAQDLTWYDIALANLKASLAVELNRLTDIQASIQQHEDTIAAQERLIEIIRINNQDDSPLT